MLLFYSSIFTYLSESFFFLAFCAGLWYVAGRYLAPAIKRLFPGITVTQEFLQRFAVWQIVFVAAWSVFFKLMLPLYMHSKTGPLFKGPSQWFAGAAEYIGGVLALIAIVRWLLQIGSYFRTLLNRGEVKHAHENP